MADFTAPSGALSKRGDLPLRPEGYRRDAYAVWEITLKCNLACTHCGSRAGEARPDELNTEEALELVRQMAENGITEVTLIGGEAFLRPDWLTLVRAITDAGMGATMVTGGFGVNRFTAKKMKEAGLSQVSVSIDGMEATHDLLRGKAGSWKSCFETLKHLQAVKLPTAFNTQINRLSAPELPQLYQAVREVGVNGWQYSLTVPMGNAADRPERLIQPFELLDLFPVLARITNRANAEGVRVLPGNDIGYYGPYENIIHQGRFQIGTIWQGCGAGLSGIGIEADGKIKGCPSLPTDSYVGGNIRDIPLSKIMESKELTFNMHGGTPKGTEHLWGFCKGCRHAELCRGGCTWTAHVFFDKSGNNPHCHHRALELASKGVRERVRMVEKAAGLPFDNGRFELLEEPLDAPLPGDPLRFTREKVVWPPGWEEWPWPD
jgi:radical SAM protein with 4Fe4S-binding SPASM domain